MNFDDIIIFRDSIDLRNINEIAKNTFGEMAKAVIDIERKIIAIGGELHADAENILLEDGSKQANLWGINLYPEKHDEDLVQYHSLINVRPLVGNRSQEIEDPAIRRKIYQLITEMLSRKAKK